MELTRADSEILTFAPDTRSYTEYRFKKSQLRYNYRPRAVVDQKRAIFVRITGIALKSSGDFAKLGEAQESQPPSKTRLRTARRYSIREKKSSTTVLKKTKRRGLFKSSTAKASSKRVSTSDAVEEYLDVYEKPSRFLNSEGCGRKANSKGDVVALEEAARHIDEMVYKSSTDNCAAGGRFGEEEKVAAIWRDMGIDIVRSKRKPSLLEIVLPEDKKVDASGRKQAISDRRKSTVYKLFFGDVDAGATVAKTEKQSKNSSGGERGLAHVTIKDSESKSTDTDEEFFDASCDVSPRNVHEGTRPKPDTSDPSTEIKFKGQTPKAEPQRTDKVFPPAPSENIRGLQWRSLSKGTTIGTASSLRQLVPNILSFRTSKSSLPTETARVSCSRSQAHQKFESHNPTKKTSSASVSGMTAGRQMSSEQQVVKTSEHNRGHSSRMPTEDTSEIEEFFDALEKMSKESFRLTSTKYVKLMENAKKELLGSQDRFPHSSTSPHPLDIRWRSSHADNERFFSAEELGEAEWIRLKQTRQKQKKEQRKRGCSIN